MIGKIPWRRAWQPTPVFSPGETLWREEPGGPQSMGSQSQTWWKWISTHAGFPPRSLHYRSFLTKAEIRCISLYLNFEYFKPRGQKAQLDILKLTLQLEGWNPESTSERSPAHHYQLAVFQTLQKAWTKYTWKICSVMRRGTLCERLGVRQCWP